MNRLERERRVRNIEFYAAFGVMTAECTRALAVHFINMPHFLAWNAGNFAWGYDITWLINAQMELSGWDKKLSERNRFLIGGAFSLTTAVLNETVLPVLGTPGVEDIPAAVIGVGCSIAVRKLAQRWVNSQVR